MIAPVYMGIDQSVGGCGITVIEPTAGLSWTNVKSFPLKKFGGREVRQLAALEDYIIQSVAQYHDRIKVITREGFNYGAKQGREKSGAIAYAVDSVLVDWVPSPTCYPYVIPPSKLKFFATGKGGATKQEVIAAVRDLWGKDFGKDDNAADSFVLAQIAYAIDGGHTGSPWQDEVLAGILTSCEDAVPAVG